MNRIHICGTYGSGKSTIARKLSELEGLPCYHLDDLKYEVKYSKTRGIEERILLLEEICSQDRWILEGTWTSFAEEAFAKSNIIIHMAFPKLVCSYNVLKRYFGRQKFENDTFIGAMELIRQIRLYYESDQEVSFSKHQSLIAKYKKPSVLIRNKSEIDTFIKERHTYL